MVIGGEIGEEWAVLKDEKAELLQVHRWQGRIKRPDEVFVEPLGLLHLETYSFHRLELFLGEIYDKAYTEVVEPLSSYCQHQSLYKESKQLA